MSQLKAYCSAYSTDCWVALPLLAVFALGFVSAAVTLFWVFVSELRK